MINCCKKARAPLQSGALISFGLCCRQHVPPSPVLGNEVRSFSAGSKSRIRRRTGIKNHINMMKISVFCRKNTQINLFMRACGCYNTRCCILCFLRHTTCRNPVLFFPEKSGPSTALSAVPGAAVIQPVSNRLYIGGYR